MSVCLWFSCVFAVFGTRPYIGLIYGVILSKIGLRNLINKRLSCLILLSSTFLSFVFSNIVLFCQIIKTPCHMDKDWHYNHFPPTPPSVLEVTYTQVCFIIKVVSSSPIDFYSEKIGFIRVTNFHKFLWSQIQFKGKEIKI